MNEMNPRANLPSLLLNHGEPPVVYRTNWVVVTRPFLMEDRNSLYHETDRIRHPREPHNWVSKRTTSKELCFHFFVEIEIKFFKKGVGIMNAGQVKKRTSLLLVLITSSLKRNRFFWHSVPSSQVKFSLLFWFGTLSRADGEIFFLFEVQEEEEKRNHRPMVLLRKYGHRWLIPSRHYRTWNPLSIALFSWRARFPTHWLLATG